MSGVEIRVRSNSRQAQQDLNRLSGSVKNIENSVSSVTKAFKTLAISIGAAFTGGAFAKGINGATDSLTSLENRIALVVGRGKELNNQLDVLYRISKETKAPIDATVETFNRFGIALKESGRSTEEINRAIKSVGIATAISGGSAESTRAALFQLGQGLASGQLRGQELNSVLEQAPRLARVISDSLNVPFGSLRKLAEEGKITTEVVFEALLDQSTKLEAEFSQIEGTSGKAMAVLGDQIRRVTGEISKQLNITSSYTAKINALSDYIEANRQGIVSSVAETARTFTNAFTGFYSIGRGLFRIIEVVIGRLVDALPNVTTPFRELTQIITEKAIGAFLSVNAALRRIGINVEGLVRRITDTKFAGAFQRIFSSSSLKEFGDALYNLGDVLDRYGRRWYNVGNLTERAFRRTRIFLIESGIALGIFEQSLFRLRYDSFERLSKAAGVLSDAFVEIRRNILASEVFVALQVAILKTVQYLRNFGEAVDNVFGNVFSKALENVTDIFIGIRNVASNSLDKTIKVVKNFAETINYYFFWIYDKVIGNSWWTDTMQDTYNLANAWLTRTKNIVSSFAKEVSEMYRFISLVLKSRLSTETKIELVVGGLKFKAQEIATSISDLAKPVAATVSDGVRRGFSAITEVSPKLSALLALGLATAFTRVLSPNFFQKTFAKLGPVLFVTIATSIATAFDSAFLKSNFLSEVAKGLGIAIGEAVNAIVSNLPTIFKEIVKAASGFGNSLADAISGTLIGLPAQILSFFPGGGLLTTILYGGVASAVFFSGIRKQLLGFATQALTSIGSITGSGLLYNLFVGSKPQNLAKNVMGGTRRQRAEIAGQLAAENKRKGKLQLASLAGVFLGAELLLGEFIGNTGALVLSLGFPIIQKVLTGDNAVASSIISNFNGTLDFGKKKVKELLTAPKGGGLLLVFSSIAARAKAAFGSIGAANTVITSKIPLEWRRATAASYGPIVNFATGVRKQFFKIAGLGLLLGGIFTGFASASEESNGEVATSYDNLFASLLGAAFLFAGSINDLFKKLFKSKTLTGLGARIAVPFSAAFGKISVAVGAVIGTITGIIPAILGTIAAITAIFAGFSLYSLFFGEGDTFAERMKNNFQSLSRYFGFFKKDVQSLRKEIVRTVRSAEANLEIRGIKVDLTAQLEKADLGDLSARQREELKKEVQKLSGLQAKAIREEATLGRVTEETRRAIKDAVQSIDSKTKPLDQIGQNTTASEIDALNQFANALRKDLGNFLFSPEFAALEDRDKIGLRESILAISSNLDQRDSSPEAIAALAANTVGLINQLEASGIQLPVNQLQPLAQALVEGQGTLTANVVDALEGNRVFGITGTKALGESVVKAINEDQALRDRQLLETTLKGTRQSITELADQFNLELPENFQFLGLEQLRDLLSSLREIRNASVKADPLQASLAEGTNNFERSEQLRAGALQSEITTFNRSKIAYENLVEAFNKGSREIELTIGSINSRLGSLGIGGIETFGSRLGDSEEYVLAISSGLKAIENSENKIKELRADNSKTQKEINDLISAEQKLINKNIAGLRTQLELANAQNVQEGERLGIVESAISSFDKFDIDLNKLLGIDKGTLDKLVLAQAEVGYLTLKLQQLALSKTADASAVGATQQALAEAEKIVQDTLNSLRSRIEKTDVGQTVFEKFLGRLDESGFSMDVSQAASLGRKAVSSLQAPLIAIEKAQKRIINSSLEDVKTRKAAVQAIKEQRDRIFEILSLGSLQDRSIALEGLGVDPALAKESEYIRNLGLEIRDLEEELYTKKGLTLEQEEALTRQIERRKQIIDGLTTQAEEATNQIQGAFENGFKSLLKGETSIKGFFRGLMDDISNTIIDTVVQSFTQAFFEAAGLKSTFDKLFQGLFSGGDGLGNLVGDEVKQGAQDAFENSGDLVKDSNFFKSIGNGLQGFFKDFGSGITELLGSFGNGIGSIFGFIGGLFGFGGGSPAPVTMNSGGIVPHTPFSQTGIDSVPAMLTPGELVVPANKVDKFLNNDKSNSTVVNLSITGDVSRQTRQEIVKMLPTIASGVNAQNKERNYKYR